MAHLRGNSNLYPCRILKADENPWRVLETPNAQLGASKVGLRPTSACSIFFLKMDFLQHAYPS